MFIFFVCNTLLVGMTIVLHGNVAERYWSSPGCVGGRGPWLRL